MDQGPHCVEALSQGQETAVQDRGWLDGPQRTSLIGDRVGGAAASTTHADSGLFKNFRRSNVQLEQMSRERRAQKAQSARRRAPGSETDMLQGAGRREREAQGAKLQQQQRCCWRIWRRCFFFFFDDWLIQLDSSVRRCGYVPQGTLPLLQRVLSSRSRCSGVSQHVEMWSKRIVVCVHGRLLRLLVGK
jgi:hypothetical protein